MLCDSYAARRSTRYVLGVELARSLPPAFVKQGVGVGVIGASLRTPKENSLGPSHYAHIPTPIHKTRSIVYTVMIIRALVVRD